MNTASLQVEEVSLLSVGTLVLWSVVLAIGVAGFVVPYARPVPPAQKQPPVLAETLNVELTADPLPAASMDLPAASVPPPLDAPVVPLLESPTLTPVADPSVVAFAVPVEGPVQVVEPKRAAFAAPAIRSDPAPAVRIAQPQQLVYGQGEGRQPAPEYPYRARRDGQEGVVTVRLSVAESGQVLAAETALASPWPLLNEAAVRVVRERWRFRPGAARLYEVSIRFQLTR